MKKSKDGAASFAEDLVRQTLSRHGLLPGTGQGDAADGGGPFGDMSRLGAMMQGFGAGGLAQAMGPGGFVAGGMAASGMAAGGPVVPDGAQFLSLRFDCAAGGRAYRLYVPDLGSRKVQGVVLMLHGCTQTAEDFALGTGMNALAEARGFLVIYPQQSRGDNAQSCWNWFSRGDQLRDRGEPAILAGMVAEVMGQYGVPPGRACVAGLSAGAAMAVILGQTYPEVFSAVGVHSGLAYGAARDVGSAFAAMSGAGPDLTARPETTRGGAPRVIVFHGSADTTVNPVNAERIVRQVLDQGPAQVLQRDSNGTTHGRNWRRQVTQDDAGRVLLEDWRIDGLGHAWSGGQAAGSYTDAAGPDASAEMVRFFFGPQDVAG